MNDSTTLRLLTRSAGKKSTLIVLGLEPDAAQRVADQFEFLDVSAAITAPQGLRSAVEHSESPLAVVLLTAGCGEAAQAAVSDVLEAHADLPLVIYDDGDMDPALGKRMQERIVSTLRPPLRYADLAELVRELRLIQAQGGFSQVQREPVFRSLVGRSAGIQAVRRMITRVAPWEATVQLLGETGTGKEVVARNIHAHSSRRHGPFVAVNCGAIPADLLESELFGHDKGAFTGALTARKGRFELASGGTLFLDEIGDMPLDMQVKLLRVLQERRFEPLGSDRTVEADVRIVAATHRDLEEMIREGQFREDLYYRLNVVPIEVPPLRERRQDLPLLIAELNAQLRRRGMPTTRFDRASLIALARHDWPGNVRELANLVERCAILAPDREVSLADLPARLRDLVPPDEQPAADGQADERLIGELGAIGLPKAPAQGVKLKSVLEDIEVRLIRQALDNSEGVVAQAAQLLGLRRTTLVEKMRKFQIGRFDEVTEF
ncbi:MAG: sigma-54-dependent Fis family transcriptional regulator [Gammaproteobacteria bacterium]|nr:sigma-54-dependent Fis family transcriptional regulator [Gammaproteobacteria bacterium]